MNVRQRILDVYSRHGFASIDPADLRGRFRWYGLYTQRRPGIPGGRTATLEPEELDDEFFMLRVRLDGGRLSTEQLRVVAGVATDLGRDVADVTDRQNVQLHWIRIEDVPEIWERLEAVGLGTTEACGDTPRTVLGCPLAGVAADEVVDGTAGIVAVTDRWLGDPAFSNLPRKFKTSLSGCASHCTLHEVNDVGFVGVVHPELGAGFDLWVGGGLSTNPRAAVRLGAFVRPDRVEEVWAGVTGLFRDWGYRRTRTRARLKFLVADEGAAWVRETLERDYLAEPLPDGPAPEPVRARRDHVGVHRQHDGRDAVGAVLRVGRTSGTQLARVADLAEAHGSTRVRATPQQNLVVLDVDPARTEDLVAALAAEGLEVRPRGLRRAAMACTGIEFCKLAIVETKATADRVVDEVERRLPDLDEPVAVQVNGCPTPAPASRPRTWG